MATVGRWRFGLIRSQLLLFIHQYIATVDAFSDARFERGIRPGAGGMRLSVGNRNTDGSWRAWILRKGFHVIDRLTQFYRSLRKRGLTQAKLAELAVTGWAHLCQVLHNKKGRGHFTRRRVFPHLTEEEVSLLGWAEEYAVWRQKNRPESASSTGNIVPIPG